MSLAAPDGFPPPRPFQVEAIEGLRGRIRKHVRALILCAPTGAGKTYTAMWLVKLTLGKGRRVVFIADRISLIDQTSQVADGYGLDHGVIQGNHPRRAPEKPFQIASTQTVGRRGELPDADLYIIDEAHTQYTRTLGLLTGKKAVVIGLTATPCTQGLEEFFDDLINAVTMESLTAQGILVPLRIYRGPRPDMRGVKKIGGEWSAAGSEKRCVLKIADVVREWAAKAEGRKTIAFGPMIGYAELLAAAFEEVGVHAAAYTMSTAEEARKELVAEFRKPDSAIQVLTSVEALGKGFDVPDVGCIIDARPFTRSLSSVIQMWGRGVRAAPGKHDCILLDCSGNAWRFWPDFQVIFKRGFETLLFSQEADKKARETDEEALLACPKCGSAPFEDQCAQCGYREPAVRRCPNCGSEGFRTHCRACGYSEIGDFVDVIDGDLSPEPFDVHGASAVRFWRQICAHVERSRCAERKRRWRAAYIFRDFVGELPPPAWAYLPADDGCPMEIRRRIWARDAEWHRAHPIPSMNGQRSAAVRAERSWGVPDESGENV